MSEIRHLHERAEYARWCSDHAEAIEDMAEALADEQGLRLNLLGPDSRAFIMALATRAVRHGRFSFPSDIGPDAQDKLEDAEGRIEDAVVDLRQLLDKLPLPADKLAAALEGVIGLLTMDNS